MSSSRSPKIGPKPNTPSHAAILALLGLVLLACDEPTAEQQASATRAQIGAIDHATKEKNEGTPDQSSIVQSVNPFDLDLDTDQGEALKTMYVSLPSSGGEGDKSKEEPSGVSDTSEDMVKELEKRLEHSINQQGRGGIQRAHRAGFRVIDWIDHYNEKVGLRNSVEGAEVRRRESSFRVIDLRTGRVVAPKK